MEDEAQPLLLAVSQLTGDTHFHALSVDNFALIVLAFFIYFTITVALEFNQEGDDTLKVSLFMVIILIGVTNLCFLYLIVAMYRSHRASIKFWGTQIWSSLRHSFHHTWKLALTIIIGALASIRYGKKISLETYLYDSGIEKDVLYMVLALAVLTFAILQIVLFSEYFFLRIFSYTSADRLFHLSRSFYATIALAITSNTVVGYQLIREELLWREFPQSWFYLHPFDIEFCLMAIAFWVELMPHKKDNRGRCYYQDHHHGYGSLAVFDSYPLVSCTSVDKDSFNDEQLSISVNSLGPLPVNSGSSSVESLEMHNAINIGTGRSCWIKHLPSIIYRETFKKPTVFFIVLNIFLVAEVFIWLTLCENDESDYKTQIPLLIVLLILVVVECIIYFRYVKKLEDLKIFIPLQPEEILLLICVIIFNSYFIILSIPDFLMLVNGKIEETPSDKNNIVYTWLEVINKTTGPLFNLVQIKILFQLRRKQKSLIILGDTHKRNFWLLLITMLTANMAFWMWNCFIRASMCGSWFYDNDYKSLWSNAMKILFPVGIFYRFHSSMVLVELMYEYYRSQDHVS